MLRVGITGGIGSGKSIVCSYFEKQQVPVYYADQEASFLIDNDPLIRKKLISSFGPGIYHGKELNKALVRSIIFHDKAALARMDAITHPAVLKHFKSWCTQRKKEKFSFVLKEAALVFESESYKELDFIACVVAPLETRIGRIIQRDQLPREKILEIIRRQMTDEEKIKRSQFVIQNGENDLLLPQIATLHQTLLTSAASHGK